MKFLVIVLLIRFMVGAILRDDIKAGIKGVDTQNENVRHPAEFILR